MELLHQFFVKLGARYVVITDIEGLCRLLIKILWESATDKITLNPLPDEGVIDKKTWLAFLSDLEEKS